MSKLDKTLQAEARAWLEGRKLGPVGKNHFLLFPDGTGWTLLVKRLDGHDSIVTGLGYPQANRMRMQLSDAGFVGKVLG